MYQSAGLMPPLKHGWCDINDVIETIFKPALRYKRKKAWNDKVCLKPTLLIKIFWSFSETFYQQLIWKNWYFEPIFMIFENVACKSIIEIRILNFCLAIILRKLDFLAYFFSSAPCCRNLPFSKITVSEKPMIVHPFVGLNHVNIIPMISIFR